jgi:hypothetical protein
MMAGKDKDSGYFMKALTALPLMKKRSKMTYSFPDYF